MFVELRIENERKQNYNVITNVDNQNQIGGDDGENRGNDLPLPPPKGDKKGKWSSSIPLWRGCRGR